VQKFLHDAVRPNKLSLPHKATRSRIQALAALERIRSAVWQVECRGKGMTRARARPRSVRRMRASITARSRPGEGRWCVNGGRGRYPCCGIGKRTGEFRQTASSRTTARSHKSERRDPWVDSPLCPQQRRESRHSRTAASGHFRTHAAHQTGGFIRSPRPRICRAAAGW
jgi:hypothetical protein